MAATGATSASAPTSPPQTAGGSEFADGYRFGKRIIPIPNEKDEWNFLQHRDEEMWKPQGGLNTTKFHNGFQRRPQTEIGQDKARLKATEAVEQRAISTADRRRQYLAQQNSHASYNIVSGQGADGGPTPPRPAKKPWAGKSEFLLREADVLLRTSASRFHRPEIVTTEKRQARLQADGLIDTTKHSSVLGFGRADIPSYGVKDNFTHAVYDTKFRPPSAGSGLSAPVGEARPRGGGNTGGSPPPTSTAADLRFPMPARDPDLTPAGPSGSMNASHTGSASRVLSATGSATIRTGSNSRAGSSHSRTLSRSQRALQADVDFVRSLQ